MRTDYRSGLSDRDRAGLKEFRQFQKDEAEREKLEENKNAYQQFVADLEKDNRRTPKSLRIERLSFDEWLKFMPSDEADPVLRGALTTHAALTSTLWRNAKTQLQGQLSDQNLELCGFDLSYRPEHDALELNDGGEPEAVREIFARFVATTPQYSHDVHWDSLCEFFRRNKLSVSLRHFQLAFGGLVQLAIAPEKPAPAPAPIRNAVNLNRAEPDPEWLKQQEKKKYREEIVCIDPRNGEKFTQYQLDHTVSADLFKFLMFGERFIPTIASVIKTGLK
jgi:hypothetical protein